METKLASLAPSPLISTDVVIAGGGMGGVHAALKIANQQHDVTLIERMDNLLDVTSNNAMYRAGFGFHYLASPKTAENYLRATIQFCHNNPSVLKDIAPEAKEGLYLLLPKESGSVVSKEQALEVILRLKETYAAAIKADPANAVFGSVDDFVQIVGKETYGPYVGEAYRDKVILAFKVPEVIINWPAYQDKLRTQVTNHPHIKLITSAKVTEVTRKENEHYILTTDKGHKVTAPVCINAAGEAAQTLNQFVQASEGESSNRVKLSLKLHLNGKLKHLPSIMFIQGPFAAFANAGNGVGYLTFADITNVGIHTVSAKTNITESLVDNFLKMEKKTQIDADFSEWLYGDIPGTIANKLSKVMQEGAVTFLPDLQDATIERVQVGVVKTPGKNMNIHDANSDIHKDRESGFLDHGKGFGQVCPAKIFYAEQLAQAALTLTEKKLAIEKEKAPATWQEKFNVSDKDVVVRFR